MFKVKQKPIETFDFQVEGSRTTYKVPLLKDLPMDKMIAARDLMDADDDLEAMIFVKSIFDEVAPGVAGAMTAEQFGELAAAYFEASGAAGITLGE